MATEPLFTSTPWPARFDADGELYPVCPCGEAQATVRRWSGWRGCPCGGATGEITSVGTPHWMVTDRRLVAERRNARLERRRQGRPD